LVIADDHPLSSMREIARNEAAQVLSPREIEIIKQVAAGLRNMEIGKRLFISEGTSRSISTTFIGIAAQNSPATPRKRDSCKRAGRLER